MNPLAPAIRPTTNIKKVRKKARWKNEGRKIVHKHEKRCEKKVRKKEEMTS
jgi:hypothetical protein